MTEITEKKSGGRKRKIVEGKKAIIEKKSRTNLGKVGESTNSLKKVIKKK